MFRRKKDLVYLELSAGEKRLLIRAMLYFRNELLAAGKPTEDVNEILLKII